MKSGKLIVNFGGGICSCLSVRLDNACRYYEQYGHFPDIIDSSNQFEIYKKTGSGDLSKIIFSNYKRDDKIPYIHFDHGWQYLWYDQIQISELSKMAANICPISEQIKIKAKEYSDFIKDRTCVLYRGNDKIKEIPETPYESIIEMAKDSNSNSFLVQTDELEFFEYFKSIFPDTIRFVDLKMIHKNINESIKYTENVSEFFTNFVAALIAIGHSYKFITMIGSTGLWPIIFRGNIDNIWQYKSDLKIWRKL